MSTISLEEWADRLRDQAGPALRRAVRTALTEFAIDAEGKSKKLATTRLNVRTGHLRRSITGTTSATGTTARAELKAGGRTGGENVKYARVQEEGAVIRPRRARFLTIPVGPALTPAGVARGTARDFPNLRFAQTGEGTRLLIDQDTGVPHFVLVREVRIPGKHYMRDGFNAARRGFPDLLADAATEAMP